jgi:hypothetical protein
MWNFGYVRMFKLQNQNFMFVKIRVYNIRSLITPDFLFFRISFLAP